MNLTIRETLSQVKVPSKAINSDSRLTNKYIYTLLKKYRDQLVKTVDSKFQLMKLDYLFQTWSCVDLEEVPSIDPCCNVGTECTIFRTKQKLPPCVTASWGPIIKRVTPIDGFTDLMQITSTQWNRKLDDTNSKYDKELYYFFQNDRIYFPNITWKKIRIEAYFEEDINKHNKCEAEELNPCKSYLDNKFRIPKELLGPCVQMVQQEIYNFYERGTPDDDQPDKSNNRKN